MVVPRCRSPWGSGACSYRGGIYLCCAVPAGPPTHHRLPHSQTGEKETTKQDTAGAMWW